MPTTAESLTTIRDAIEGLRVAARQDDDSRRADAADWLDGLFDGVETRRELKSAIRESARLFHGGMGSFQDVGTEVMHQAVERLGKALRSPWPW
ncbi:hypothetical protein [Microbacterium sp.]|uniref:DUF6966 domain-containing protein n=1 Tax=Microbacterium sp. TaxID=51671 RepID=UPI002735CAEE|nr:hypothetical protein [Microbacterium sp.]MDP3949489.1 hypothetical protein [Microbacterium sp.]